MFPGEFDFINSCYRYGPIDHQSLRVSAQFQPVLVESEARSTDHDTLSEHSYEYQTL